MKMDIPAAPRVEEDLSVLLFDVFSNVGENKSNTPCHEPPTLGDASKFMPRGSKTE